MTPKHPSKKRPWEVSDTAPINLELRFETGNRAFLAYTYLVCCQFDKSGSLRLDYGAYSAVVEGRNLGELFDSLVQHRVVCIQESSDDADVADSQPLISRLEVEKAE
jgi:hypothetical protein